jgi:hypothetical protein
MFIYIYILIIIYSYVANTYYIHPLTRMRPGERTDASCDVWRLAAVAARTAESDRADLWKVGWIYMGKYMQNIGQYMYIYTLLLLYIYIHIF